MNEYKRQQILEKHQIIQDKNNQKKFNKMKAQNFAIKNSLVNQRSTRLVSDLIKRMKMVDPNDAKKRNQLLNAMTKLNDKFGLNIASDLKGKNDLNN